MKASRLPSDRFWRRAAAQWRNILQRTFIRCLSLLFILSSCSFATVAGERGVIAGQIATSGVNAAGAEIEGVILDPTGAAVAGAEIVLRLIAGAGEWKTRSDSAGRFVFHSIADGQYSIHVSAPGFTLAERRVTVAGQNASITLTLAPASVSESVSVRAESYQEKTTSSGAKIDTPLIELPQMISVVNRQLLTDQRVITLEEALKNVAGVKAGGYYRDWDYYRIRGFDASFTTYVDGLLGENGLGEETFGLERVEVMKGPSSALYGQSVLGGIVNLQSKRPRKDAFADVQLTGGSFNFYEAAVDTGASLNKSRTLYGRLNALYRPQKSYVDFAKSGRWYAAPAVTWEIRPSTTLTALSRLQLDNNYAAFPLPAKGTVIPNINGELPIELFVGEPSNPNDVLEKLKQVGYQLTHRFGENITLHQNMRLSVYTSQWDQLLYPAYLGADERTLYRYPYTYDGKYTNFRIDTPVQATFSTGSVGHQMVAGVDYYRYRTNWHGESIDYSDPTAYLPIDLFNPVYGAVQWPSTLLPSDLVRSTNRSVGFYIQDQVRPTDLLTFTLGGRIDSSAIRDDGQRPNNDRAFSPRLGVTYQFVPGASFYFSYSESFLPQSGRVDDGTESGAFVDPEKGRQWETGIKAYLLDGRATTTLALYRLLRRNVATTNPVNPNFVLLTGEQRSQGIELETTLNLRPGWNLSAAYAYTDAEVAEDSDIPVGTPTLNVPRNSYNLWTRYEFQRGWARGIGFGIGAQYYSAQSGDLMNSFQIPSYGLAGASASYRRGRFRLQLNVNNLLNKRYFAGSYDAIYVLPGAPRTARVTAGWTF
jgi:iron complex outermembrane receptor protein